MEEKRKRRQPICVAELFAGIGGFRLGLCGWDDGGVPGAGMECVWSNQWEPPGTATKQFAWRCYESRFGNGSCVNEDIEAVLDAVEAGEARLPDFDLLCGGFPCQDYSVAKPASASKGIEGSKGVLWRQIERILRMESPRFVLLENVDRLLKSPSDQRGRDFAVILNALDGLDYSVEWRVIDASAYGFPQRRRRIFIYAERGCDLWDAEDRLLRSGVLVRAFRVESGVDGLAQIDIAGDSEELFCDFGKGAKRSAFRNAGVMQDGLATTANVVPNYSGPRMVLGDVLVPEDEVPASFYIHTKDLNRWVYLKGAKREQRVCKRNGYRYFFSEGAVAFPDSLEAPSRTILTSEGGSAASRTKHVIATPDGRLRRLTPVEIERLFGFPDGWTNVGMTDAQRAFCLGNALCVGVVRQIGLEISRMHAAEIAEAAEVDAESKAA